MPERPVIEAAFESRCAWCDQPVLEGDRITPLEDDGEWVHEHCAEEAQDA